MSATFLSTSQLIIYITYPDIEVVGELENLPNS